MKIMIAGGGTSGHINPAIAVAEELRRRDSKTEILFVGTPDRLEADIVPRSGFPIEFVEVTGLSRQKSFSGMKKNISAAAKYLKAKSRVKKLIKTFSPDVVFGTGGFVSAPVLSAALESGKKTAIHEQNAFAGVVTKMLAPKVDRVFLSFPLAKPIRIKDPSCCIVGNPVKREFLSLSRTEARARLQIPEDRPLVLSCGGSLGAKVINEAFCRMARLSAAEGTILHYHGASGGYEEVLQTLGKAAEAENIKVFPYLYNMAEVMAAADLIINRSGAITLTEIAALGRASILIPSPNVTENHQYFNAKVYSDAGAAVLIEEKDLDGEKLYGIVKELLSDRKKLKSLENAAKKLAKNDAAEKICDGLELLAGK